MEAGQRGVGEIITQSIILNSGNVLSGTKINELLMHIVNKFADEKLSPSEAILVLNRAKEVIEDFAIVQHVRLERGAILMGRSVEIEEEFKRSPQEGGHDTTADGGQAWDRTKALSEN